MLIYPAIDLLDGKVVRLREGDPRQRSVFSDDPVATAQQWLDRGAEWLHMVSLDGTFGTANQNMAILEAVAKLDVNVQFTGGLRDMAALHSARDAGASRMVIGTMAVKDPAAAGRSHCTIRGRQCMLSRWMPGMARWRRMAGLSFRSRRRSRWANGCANWARFMRCTPISAATAAWPA